MAMYEVHDHIWYEKELYVVYQYKVMKNGSGARRLGRRETTWRYCTL